MDQPSPLFRPTRPTEPFLLAADIDGTLLGDEQGEVWMKDLALRYSDSFYLALVTGRSLPSITSLIAQGRLPQPNFICSDVGTELLDCNDPENILGKKYAAQVSPDWNLDRIYAVGVGDGIWLQDFPEGQPLFQAGFYWDGQPDTLDTFYDRLPARQEYQILPSYHKYIDVIPAALGKGRVVQFLQRELGLDAESVVVAGDAGNDRQMFDTSFKGILPSNALEELKEVACPPRHYHSPYPAARGVLDGLVHFGFVKQIKTEEPFRR